MLDTSLDRTTEIKRKIETREARIGIIGMGYVGLPLALLFSEERFVITGFDTDADKVDTLNQGHSYIVRIPGTEVRAAWKNGFRATADYSCIAQMDIVIICVPTPLNEHHEPDLSFITGTAKAMAPHLREGQLVILESTTYPGTTEEVMVPLLEQGNPSGLRVARDEESLGFYVAFSPEREDPGNDTVARRDIPKVVGGCGPAALDLACLMYATIFNRTVPVSSPAAAEMTKLLENIYRCVNIALINELKQLCIRMGIDIFEVMAQPRPSPSASRYFIPCTKRQPIGPVD
jgi:UDP-N-acetyl-D-glucosamine dehydrogenase